MGVLNVTPDSFSDGGLFFEKEKAIAHGLRMVEEGADIIDIGGESTRPGSRPLGLEEELHRVIPVIEQLAKKVDTPISIDTYKSTVAQKSIEAGAQIINDISGLQFDQALSKVAAKEDTPLILMHIRGNPETMQRDIHYHSLLSEILQSLSGICRIRSSANCDRSWNRIWKNSRRQPPNYKKSARISNTWKTYPFGDIPKDLYRKDP
jgi:dihydropteroate synthase